MSLSRTQHSDSCEFRSVDLYADVSMYDIGLDKDIYVLENNLQHALNVYIIDKTNIKSAK